MKFTQSILMAGAACSLLMPTSAASAWGWQGHEYVGAVAWQLLNPNARNHVSKLLGPGVGLPLAAVWADCAKSVKGPPDYKLSKQFTAKVCDDFSQAERQQMYDYVHRNWSNCQYSHRRADCHKSFHFADVNVKIHQDYDVSYFGSGPNDVVQAIKATMIVLGCKAATSCAVPQPFNITSKREALLLLAHFAGDEHQPLHVGAVYLDGSAQTTGDSGAETVGGNALFLAPGGDNLHHVWDTVASATPTAQAISQACLIAPLPNPTPEPPEKWATESVVAAGKAYEGMSFVVDPAEPDPTEPKAWDIKFVDKPAYMSELHRVQAKQLIKAGARLAALLNSIWPSKTVAPACRH